MIKRECAQIVQINEIADETIEIVLKNIYLSHSAKPGQFLHIAVEGHTLRRPISIANIDKEKDEITILFKKNGAGTGQLAMYKPGMELDVLGPCGKGFPLEFEASSTMLLIGGGIGVPPLYYLGKELKKGGANIISILGFQTKGQVFYEERFRELGETHIVTNDGSYGKQGFVTNVTEEIDDFDCYYTCGPIPMLKAITEQLKGKPGYISLEERMVCGVGACYACIIPTQDEKGYKKICHEGPVFSAKEVLL